MVIISIDSLRPEFYGTSNFDTPTLHRLAREGAAAEKMLSVFPSVTYVNHTTMVTGVSPDRHGIVANTAFSQETGQLLGWNFATELIQVPALWNLAHAQGLHSAAFSWPVSVGAQIDWNIPECFHLKGVDDVTTEALIRSNSTPGLFAELDQALPRPFPQDFAQWDQWLPATFNFVWREHRPDVAFVHVLNVDHSQHLFGPDSPETREAVHVADEVVARLIAHLDPATTTLFVVGDHGFASVKTNVSPNRLFADKGWIGLNGDKVSSFRVIAQTNGGSAAIYCKDPNLESEVLALLKEKGKGVFTLVSRDELDRRRSFPGALCAISAFPNYGFRGDAARPFWRRQLAP